MKFLKDVAGGVAITVLGVVLVTWPVLALAGATYMVVKIAKFAWGH